MVSDRNAPGTRSVWASRSRPCVSICRLNGGHCRESRRRTNCSREETGAFFGGRDHTTVLYAERKIARLPGPPFQFLDRIVALDGEPWVLKAGPTVEAEYDVPADAWYFAAGRQPEIFGEVSRFEQQKLLGRRSPAWTLWKVTMVMS